MRVRKSLDRLLILAFWASGLLLLAVLAGMLAYLFIRGGSSLTLDFIRMTPAGSPVGSEGGVYPAIMGTIYLVIIALITSSIPGIITAIYLTEYSKPSRLRDNIEILIQSMAGVPSIIIGLFVYALFVVQMGWGMSLFAGGIALGIMIIPVIVVSTRDALLAVNIEYRLVGLAMGVSSAYLLFRIIIPQAWPGILSGILLAMGYAAGATAPIMVTAAAVSAPVPGSLFEPVMALPYHLYILFSESISMDNAFATALLLVIILLIINALAMFLNSYQRKLRE
ncbi:Phosphate ABC transporter, permease protein PstA [Candidatus Syntrophocurvum alkaliphilum]|uniref:Phosphate transport system permease protein PstA n=1 Tax=Candidatus Syntrophocurvum alkaliphilum TaxID=2293317 RepID=A0A6I6DK60_9FIRM|nr:phosphate ABC transporter permease PstA [Candidatus Syntrophocurvum alkaliphilum]QGU00390.1 Phosphate ABC transporter, permease protein PstA [Candidatus Syntrophocurvum alkaliphilum]